MTTEAAHDRSSTRPKRDNQSNQDRAAMSQRKDLERHRRTWDSLGLD